MSPLDDEVLDRLERNAQAFLDEAARLDEAAAAVATVTNDGATVTVNASGQLVAVQFPTTPTTPDRWNRQFGEAYSQALFERPEVHVPRQVPGTPGVPAPEGPRAPEQDLVAAQIRADQARALAHLADPDEGPVTSTATVRGVTLTVNAVEVIIDAIVSTEALRDHQKFADLGEHVMAAYTEACARLAPPVP
jgi:hypothetical protein